VAALTLRTGPLDATFRPDLSMLCTSYRHRGDEFVAWPRTVTQYKTGGATAVPLMHPWVNRLGRWGYTAAGRTVRLARKSLPVDDNGLPIHGNLFGVTFDVVRATDTRVVARFDYGAHETLSRAFPFPHTVTVDVRLASRGLTIVTTISPTGDSPVPISFGWHPYLRLPRGPRSEWVLRWPTCEHIEVDAHTIPTGDRTPQTAEKGEIGARTYDDHYALGTDRRFSIANEDAGLSLRFDDEYPFAQLYVPPRRRHVAIEPMTAEIDALGGGTAPVCPPGETFRAAFTIAISR
jgi:galactose mutarotase-like enzyme